MLRRASSCLIFVTIFSLCAFSQRNRGDRPPAPTPAASPAEQAKPAGNPAQEEKKSLLRSHQSLRTMKSM